MQGGGHESLDVTAALSFCAAVTRRVRLMTYLMVLPYRNPFLSATAMASLDLLSDGRATVVAGAGYLKSEFRALGVDFEERNALFDEVVEVMRGAWASESYDHDGRHFTARGVSALPRGGAQRRRRHASLRNHLTEYKNSCERARRMVACAYRRPTGPNTLLNRNGRSADGSRRGQGRLRHRSREDALPAFPAMTMMGIPFVEPEDIAAAVLFLVSDESRYITGMQLRVDAGGYIRHRPQQPPF